MYNWTAFTFQFGSSSKFLRQLKVQYLAYFWLEYSNTDAMAKLKRQKIPFEVNKNIELYHDMQKWIIATTKTDSMNGQKEC